jgi:hypothetical protein
MMAFLPTPFPGKGATEVRGRSPLNLNVMPPPGGGPAEAAK